MIELRNAFHRYDSRTVVQLPDLITKRGEHLVVIGLSGSGKSTLLHVLAGLLNPTGGRLTIDGTELYSLRESERDRFRGRKVGIIFQQMHLIDSLTVMDNLRIAQYMAGKPENEAKIHEICQRLEITNKLNSFTDELSQGEQQRAGIARAVVNEPVLILADEPTSSLDDRRAHIVIDLLKQEAKRCGATLVISTHDTRVKRHFENVVNLDALETAGVEQ